MQGCHTPALCSSRKRLQHTCPARAWHTAALSARSNSGNAGWDGGKFGSQPAPVEILRQDCGPMLKHLAKLLGHDYVRERLAEPADQIKASG